MGGFASDDAPAEQLGFPAALLATGARAVVGALWPVPDMKFTVELVEGFHRRLDEVPAAAALAQTIAKAVEDGMPPLFWGSWAYFGA